MKTTSSLTDVSSLRVQKEKICNRRRVRLITGLSAAVASPFFGYAFPLAFIPAALMSFTRPPVDWPRHTKMLVGAALAGIAVLVTSAIAQGQTISANILHYFALALFVCAAVKLTAGVAEAAQLLGISSIGSAFFYLIFRPLNTDTFEHLWKYGVGPYCAVVITWLLCCAGKNRIPSMVGLTAVGCVSLFLNFRSHGLVCFVAVVILIVQTRSPGRRLSIWSIAASTCAFFGLAVLLPSAIKAGTFGAAVQARTMSQLDGVGPFLLAGRVEPPLSMAAILEKPWFGWGNVDSISLETINAAANIAYKLGMMPEDYMHLWIRPDGVSVHSILAEGWVEGGLVALALPSLLLALFLSAVFLARGRWAPLTVLISIQGIWNVLFSTWGYNQALILAFSAVLAAWAIPTVGPGNSKLQARMIET